MKIMNESKILTQGKTLTRSFNFKDMYYPVFFIFVSIKGHAAEYILSVLHG
jgi:hypothetical protein